MQTNLEYNYTNYLQEWWQQAVNPNPFVKKMPPYVSVRYRGKILQLSHRIRFCFFIILFERYEWTEVKGHNPH